MLLRPDDADFGEDAIKHTNYLRAVIQDSVFLGDYFRLEVLVGENLLLVHSPQPAAIGETINIAWSGSTLQCLPV